MMTEKKSLLIIVMVLALPGISSVPTAATATEIQKDYPVQPVPFSDVQITGGFWAERIKTNWKVTVPYCFRKCEETGRIDNFAVAGGLKEGTHRGHGFNDSDVFKVIEGASYSLTLHRDAALEWYLDELIAKITAAQEEDGYLFTGRTIEPDRPTRWAGKERWSNLRHSHELYNLGHLYEAAVAHYQATGKRSLLDVTVKNADLLVRTFGPDKKRDIPGHEEVEVGLVKLYRVTGKEEYLKLAKFFIDERGHYHGRKSYENFRQDHKPVVEQSEAVGHAVSGAYLYSAVADVAGLTGESEYIRALERIWEDVVSKKLYITGVAAARGEKFGRAYRLPNLKGYNETCAAIALAMWSHRMFLLHGDGKYIDVLERALYNGVISGVSLSGDKFFYSNPLASDGKYKFNGVDIPDDQMTASRMDWFVCACCPTNIVRVMPSVGGYAYAHGDDSLYINLFIDGDATIRMANNTVSLKVETRYPWDGAVKITVEPEKSAEFAIHIRIPGWAQNRPVPSDLYRYMKKSEENVTLKVNGRSAALDMEKGFARIRRRWKQGDVVDLNLPMPVRRVLCHEKVKANRGRVALERGPIVYCAEWPDNGGKVSHLAVRDDDELTAEHRKDMLGGINIIRRKGKDFVAIPYYAWAHRGEGEMAVWLPCDGSRAKPASPAILKAESFKHHVDFFNDMEKENIVNYISNSQSWAWMKKNIPLFECPDKSFEQIYYFRWWTYRKHIKQTPDGFVLTEFLAPVGHSGVYNTISCAFGHHINEGRWLHDRRYINEYSLFWYRKNNGGPQKHFHRYSNWATDALYNRYLVNGDKDFVFGLLGDFIADYERWEKERLLDNGLFWQYDVWDGMEESISGSRRHKNARPPLNSYMYANAAAILKIAEMASRKDIAKKYSDKAAELKSLVQNLLWDGDAKFFKVRHESGKLADVREEIGLIPWYFNLSDAGYEEAWLQILDPAGFKAPMGLMTAERRHPDFRSHGVGTCEWDGAVWPFGTTQSLVGLANVLRNYEQKYVSKQDYFDALMTYARSHRRKGKPYIGEYLDEKTGQWLTRDSDRSRYYNHSGFCDLVITGLVGLEPRADDTVEVHPLVPTDTWDWFCLDKVLYHGRIITILWDKTGNKYGKGKGLRVYADGRELAQSSTLGRVRGQPP